MVHCKQTLAAALLVSTTLVACGGGSEPGQDDVPGQAVYGRYCAGCHGMQGQGRPPSFPPLADSEWLALPPQGLTAIILLGLRGEIEVVGRAYAGYMPPMQHIDDERVAEIVRYIKNRWSSAAEEWTAEDVARLRGELAGRRTPEGRAGVDRLLEEMQ